MRYDRWALRRLMKERGTDVHEVVKGTGLTRGNVRFLERGMTEPKASTIAKLATFFGVNADAFFSGDGRDEAA